MGKSQKKMRGRDVAATGTEWLYNPGLDLTAGCGAWSAPLLLLTYFIAQSSEFGMAVAFYALALVFNYPHYMATIYRAYGTREDFSKYRVFTVHLTLLLVLAGVLTHASFRALPWVFTAYVMWSPWHYSGQNYGLLMMFARRSGVAPSRTVRNALYAAFLLSFLVLLVSFNTGPSSDPLVLSLGIPQRISIISRITGAVVFAGLGGYAFWHLLREAGMRRMLAPLTLFSTQILWFVLPSLLDFSYGLRLPQTRYSSGILAIMHSAQYLWVTSYYAKREAITLEKGEAGWNPWRYFGTLTAGGIALFVPGPWLVSYIFRYDFTASFLIFTALVNIHHFILDGAIWKLRDGRIAALLLNRRERTAVESAAPAIGAATHWLRGKQPSARALRTGAFAALLLWAAVDEARYYLGGSAQGISSLSLAARLNPYDSVVQMRLARAQSGSGDYEASVAALRRAIASNPTEPAPQLELARAYIAHGSYAEAYAQYQRTLLLVPHDADALSNFGILASRLGHGDEAIRAWQRTLTADPARADVHLYLAEVLQAQGKSADAAAQYQAYLQWLATHPEQRPAPQKMITVLLRYAGVSAQMHQPETAQRLDALAINIAQQTHQPALESFAHAAIANVQAQSGETGAAALSYQQALALDAALPDRRSEAADWFNYGEFLRQHGQSKLGFACMLKAEELLQANQKADAPELKTASAAREQLEKELGKAAMPLHRDLPKLIARATVLKPQDFAVK